MSKPKILLQLDGDPQASTFDAVVAIDAGVDHLFTRRQVEPSQVRDLIHGLIFTRGPGDLHNSAVFVGGSDVAHAERLLQCVSQTFFGPMRVSVMLDANGANTTAAAAVLAAARHTTLSQSSALVLGGTGPVGRRAALLLAKEGASVRVASRQLARAEEVCRQVLENASGGDVSPHQTSTPEEILQAMSDVQTVIAAGAIGVQLLSKEDLAASKSIRVVVDLNAVPPLGIESVEVGDKAVDRDGVICYGAIGVGGAKMKIHKAALQKLFERNDLVLDAEHIYALGKELE